MHKEGEEQWTPPFSSPSSHFGSVQEPKVGRGKLLQLWKLLFSCSWFLPTVMMTVKETKRILQLWVFWAVQQQTEVAKILGLMDCKKKPIHPLFSIQKVCLTILWSLLAFPTHFLHLCYHLLEHVAKQNDNLDNKMFCLYYLCPNWKQFEPPSNSYFPHLLRETNEHSSCCHPWCLPEIMASQITLGKGRRREEEAQLTCKYIRLQNKGDCKFRTSEIFMVTDTDLLGSLGRHTKNTLDYDMRSWHQTEEEIMTWTLSLLSREQWSLLTWSTNCAAGQRSKETTTSEDPTL